MTNAHRMLEVLEGWGVEYVFCCPGTSEVPVLDALAERDPAASPRFILTTHEAISVAMADGYARASQRPSVAYLHTNVGLANGLAHTYAAQVARSAITMLVGIKPTETLRHRALTTSPGMLSTAAPYAVHTWQNVHAADLTADVDETLRRSRIAPGGPAVLAIPQDHLSSSDESPLRPAPQEPVRLHPDPAQLRAAADLLRSAPRVLIVAGSDVARRRAEHALTRIAEALAAPVMIDSRRDIERWPFPTTDPHFVGLFEPHGPIAEAADVVLLVGSPTPIEFGPGMPVLPKSAQLIHHSEDHAEAGRRGAPQVSLAGDTALSLESLADLLVDVGARDQHFLEEARRTHDEAMEKLRREIPEASDADGFSAATAMRTMAETLGGEGTLVLDAVTSTLPLLRFLQRPIVDTVHATASGSLGWGMGAALGVALATRKRVIAVVGDGVLQFGVPALWTARHENLPVTFVVVNNGLYQAVVSGLTRFDGAARRSETFPLTDISGVDAAALAASFGMASHVAHTSAEFVRLLEEEKTLTPDSGPRLIDVRVDGRLWQ